MFQVLPSKNLIAFERSELVFCQKKHDNLVKPEGNISLIKLSLPPRHRFRPPTEASRPDLKITTTEANCRSRAIRPTVVGYVLSRYV